MKVLFEFTRKEKVEDKEIVHKYALLKPGHSLREEAGEFNAMETSRLVGKGVLTKKMLQKKLLDAGIYSEEEKEQINSLYKNLDEKLSEFRVLLDSESKEKTPESEEEIKKVGEELIVLRKAVQNFEFEQISLFDNTAEVIARNRVLFWWSLILLLEEKNGKYEHVFNKKGGYDSLKDQYDAFIDDNQYNLELLGHIGEIVVGWALNRIETKEDFEEAWVEIEKSSAKLEEASVIPQAEVSQVEDVGKESAEVKSETD